VFKVPISKGHKGRNITLSDQVKEEFKLYRTALGLSPLPQKNEYTPLFPRISKGKPTFTGLGIRRIREIIDALFKTLSEECYELGRENDGDTFKSATPHWLRHTGISHDINIHGRSLTDVRDDAGHDSVETTSKYIHSSIRERYESVKNKQL
jgi:integrase